MFKGSALCLDLQSSGQPLSQFISQAVMLQLAPASLWTSPLALVQVVPSGPGCPQSIHAPSL